MRIAIVGADSRAWAKIPDGELKAKTKIKEIIMAHYIDFDNFGKVEPELDPIIVSGHCPVGKELQYCVDCKLWEPLFKTNFDCDPIKHRFIEVYNQGGVDSWAEIIATELGLKKEIYPAKCTYHHCLSDGTYEGCKKYKWDTNHFWYYHFKPRNIQITEAGLKTMEPYVLYNIVVGMPDTYCYHHKEKGHLPSGGCWTENYAKKLKREVHKIIIE